MRKIKFRAWDKENKEMFTGFSFKDIYSGHDESYIYDENDKWWSQPNWDNAVLMQYTGSKDEKGKEIYEGDIVEYQFEDSFMKLHNISKTIYIVIYQHGCFLCSYDGKKVIGNQSDIASNIVRYKTLKVLGNIYENPEILKEYNEKRQFKINY